MQQTHHLQTSLLPMQHNTYPLDPQNTATTQQQTNQNPPQPPAPSTSQHKTRTKQATPHPFHTQSSANNNPQNTTQTSNTLNAPPQTQTSATNNPQPRNKQLKILQINVNGIQNKTAELEQLLTQENIDIPIIQETKQNPTNKTPQFL